MDAIQLSRADVNGGFSMFPESTYSRSGKILTSRIPALGHSEPIADWRNLHDVDFGRRRPAFQPLSNRGVARDDQGATAQHGYQPECARCGWPGSQSHIRRQRRPLHFLVLW